MPLRGPGRHAGGKCASLRAGKLVTLCCHRRTFGQIVVLGTFKGRPRASGVCQHLLIGCVSYLLRLPGLPPTVQTCGLVGRAL